MADIDTRPQTVDIAHYAGDTLTIKITVPAGLADGYVWTAQVRKDRLEETPIDATFVVMQPVAPGDPGYITLTAADCSALARTEGVRMPQRRMGKQPLTQMVAVKTYLGVWDCQVAHPSDPDPVITVAQGSLALDLDVTREVAP